METARDYAAYLQVDINQELTTVGVTIEEMLTRLDEFEHLVTMVRADSGHCTEEILPRVVASRPFLDELCERVDRLEQLVLRVEADLTQVEAIVDKAEQDLASSGTGRLKTFLKPLFFKSPTETTTKKPPQQTPIEALGEIFNTEDFFPLEKRDT